ncbi:hypothetical protein BpHYR1_002250, partial [Brachionus plicatilis]
MSNATINLDLRRFFPNDFQQKHFFDIGSQISYVCFNLFNFNETSLQKWRIDASDQILRSKRSSCQ